VTRFTGTPEAIAAQSRQQQDLLWQLYARLARRTGRPPEEIAEDMRRGRYLDAREAGSRPMPEILGKRRTGTRGGKTPWTRTSTR
jgi:hypothetical protein